VASASEYTGQAALDLARVPDAFAAYELGAAIHLAPAPAKPTAATAPRSDPAEGER
jgi:hypothetical protein